MFNKIMVVGLAAAAMLTSPSALAQPWGDRDYHNDRDYRGGYGYDYRVNGIEQKEQNIERMLRHGERTGALNPREDHRMRNYFNQILDTERQYRRHGLDPSEVRDLNYRLDRLTDQVNYYVRNA